MTDKTERELRTEYAEFALFEQLAAIEHERWADWQEYVHSKCAHVSTGQLIIPAELVEQWRRQIRTPYVHLSEREKESDRDQVRRYWHLVQTSRVDSENNCSDSEIAEENDDG
jgi:hypothetical protein